MSGLTQHVWALSKLKENVGEGGRPFNTFLDNDTMRTELYELPAGANDLQSPHEWDELYYIISGRSGFTADGVTSNIQAGDTIFVRAKIAHKFHDITEDLSVLVFFSKQEPS